MIEILLSIILMPFAIAGGIFTIAFILGIFSYICGGNRK